MARRPFFQSDQVKLSADLKAFEGRIGYKFVKPELLNRAVTHASMSSANRDDNQRLEFLGDRVLGLVMSEALLALDPGATEGQLAPRFNALVRKETCADVAREIDMGAVLKLGRSEMLSGGRRKQALLGDAIEAIIAAIYLDGGLEPAKDFILRHWGDRVNTVKQDARDAKTALQEWAQARGYPPPSYTQTDRQGPDHAPVFTISAQVENGAKAVATAPSKRQAEQAAAKTLLAQLEKNS
ncbi:MAG: ribonuclease-3 [Sulfitobacter sp.]